ncbi:MAG: aldo/keto reductase family oxidoreductase, partial [Alteromonadaceae bacterium]|nr:aldo/keto reductase family oxidoreductase [Alteromonadaceae bacterium]
MKNINLGKTVQQVPNVIAGMMRIGDKSDAEIRALYDSARTAGVTYFDHADLYGFNFPNGGYHLC